MSRAIPLRSVAQRRARSAPGAARLPDLREQSRSRLSRQRRAARRSRRAVIDGVAEFYRTRLRQRASRRLSPERRARPTLYEEAREKVRRFLNAADAREIVFVRGATEAINLVAQSWGPTFLKAGDEVLITELEHHANIVPWQIAARPHRHQAGRGADRRDRRARHGAVRGAAQPAHQARRGDACRQRHRRRAAGREHRAARARQGRQGAGRRLPGGAAAAGRRAGARLRFLCLLRPQDLRPDRHRRALRQARRCSTRCRPGRAAAT